MSDDTGVARATEAVAIQEMLKAYPSVCATVGPIITGTEQTSTSNVRAVTCVWCRDGTFLPQLFTERDSAQRLERLQMFLNDRMG